MPNKKPRYNASKGKGAAPGASADASSGSVSASTAPPGAATTSYTPPDLPPPSLSDDFWTKNARAKALIMSTLVPGSEPWKIAEPLELASDIWKALEERYAPKDGKLKLKNLMAGHGRTGKKTEENGVPAEPVLGAKGGNRPVDQNSLARAQLDGFSGSKITGAATEQVRKDPDATSVEQHVDDEEKEEEEEQEQEKQDDQAPEACTGAAPTMPARTPGCGDGRWKATPVQHDSYLSEQQALAFAQADEVRKKQIQVAATKVLMQKLPSRDLRLLWAVLYGGENAPWPGSCSVVIPGVTTTTWHNKTYEWLQGTWNSRAEEKG